MDAWKLARRIKRAGRNSKQELYLSVYGADREAVLKELILGLPPKTYSLSPRGFGDSLKEIVQEAAGVFASIDVTERILRGLSVEHPERIQVAFTLGLDEVIISPKKRKRT